MTKNTIRLIEEYDSVLDWCNKVYAENAEEAIEHLLTVELPKYSFGHAIIFDGKKEIACYELNYLRKVFVQLSKQHPMIKISFYSKNSWGYAKSTYRISKLKFI